MIILPRRDGRAVRDWFEVNISPVAEVRKYTFEVPIVPASWAEISRGPNMLMRELMLVLARPIPAMDL
jgi:hypothetical protein